MSLISSFVRFGQNAFRTGCRTALRQPVQAAGIATSRMVQHQHRGPGARVGEPKGIDGIDTIIAVSSAKGGVGKSTTAVNLSLALSAQGKSVGLLDGDIYGPSIPRMLNLSGKPLVTPDEKMVPMENYGIKCNSMGFLLDDDTAAVWRGPMVMAASEQLLRKTDWGPLDVLVIDLPPGTGDVHLTLTQNLALTGAVVVSTPQEIALMDARRGVTMFRKVHVPILGVVENMSHYECPSCHAKEFVFGESGAQQMCTDMDVPFLGDIPLDITVRETSDAGRPILVSNPDHPVSLAYKDLAARVDEATQKAKAESSKKTPIITVED